MDFSVAEANALLDKMELPLGGLGFVLGSIGKDLKANAVYFDALTTENKVKWILRKVIGKTTGITLFKDELGATKENFTFKATGFINKYLGIAIFSYIYKELGGPYAGTLSKILWPIGVGGAIGGFFDPAALQTPEYNPALAGAAGAPLIPQQLKRSVWS